jgi:hypothetical protein
VGVIRIYREAVFRRLHCSISVSQQNIHKKAISVMMPLGGNTFSQFCFVDFQNNLIEQTGFPH